MTVALTILILGCSSSPEVNVCDCMNKRGYGDIDGKFYKPCQKKFQEVFGTTEPSTEQMVTYTLNNCCKSYPEECEKYRNAGY